MKPEFSDLGYSSGHVLSKTKSVTPNFFCLFGNSILLPFFVASLKKICAWELLGANVLKGLNIVLSGHLGLLDCPSGQVHVTFHCHLSEWQGIRQVICHLKQTKTRPGQTGLNNICACARSHCSRWHQQPGHHNKPWKNGYAFKKFRMMPCLWWKCRATLKTVERNLYT